MSHRLMARLEFDAGRLREFLQLPETAEIVGCQMDIFRRGKITLVIEGAGYPTKEGEFIQPATCMIRTQTFEDGTRLRDELRWPFVAYPDGDTP